MYEKRIYLKTNSKIFDVVLLKYQCGQSYLNFNVDLAKDLKRNNS